MSFIIGRKIEMTQQFKDDGTVVPVTLVEAHPNTVTQIRDLERDGYTAVQVGCDEVKSISKPQEGHLKDLPRLRKLKEFRVSHSTLQRGDLISVNVFTPGMKVDVVGFSKGRGYAGVMKRHHFSGGKASHGNKDQQRMPGSLASQRQGKVIKGQRMSGRMGNDRVTIKNLEVISVKPEQHLLAIKGAVPGARGSLLLITSHESESIWQR